MSLVMRLMLGMGLAVLIALMLAVGTVTIMTNKQLSTFNVELFQKSYSAKAHDANIKMSQYIEDIEKQIVLMADNTSTREAAQSFIYGLEYLPTQARLDLGEIRPSVEQYYTQDFAQEYSNYNADNPDFSRLVAQLDDTALILQYLFISDNPSPLGSKSEMVDSGNSNTLNYEHIRHHENFKKFLETYSFYDIFMVDIETSHVFYSVFKELDFGTSLADGPFANSGLAEAFNKGQELESGETYLTNFEAYFPSYNNAASFMSTPIFNTNGEKIAVLIYQMPINTIADLLTHNHEWEKNDFGETGETYIIGDDYVMRSESREFFEHPDEFIARLEEHQAGYQDDVEARGTTIGIHKIKNEAVEAALRGETGFTEVIDFKGNPTYTAYEPVEFGSFRWAVIAELEQKEALAVVGKLTSSILTVSLFVTLGILIVAIGFAILFARIVIKPLNMLSGRFELLNSADADLTTRVDSSGIPEIDRISNGFNTFITLIHNIVGAVKENAEIISSASAQLEGSSEQANKAAQLQLEETEKVNDALSQFNVAIEEVATQSTAAADSTSSAKDIANESSAQSLLSNQKINVLVDEIGGASKNLTDVQTEVKGIVDVLMQITSIADQTNLLALNAAIEAARAGETGRGFAVVADEVRSLAMRTQESTVQIHEGTERLTKTVNSAVDSMASANTSAIAGIDLVNQVTEKIQALDDAVSSLTEINQSVAAAAEEQKYTAGAITENVDIVSSSSVELGESSSDVAKATLELSRIAEELSDNVRRFKT